MPPRRLALVAVVAASVVSCRGGCARHAADTNGGAPAADERLEGLALLPADAGMVMLIDVAKLRKASILTNFPGTKAATLPVLAGAIARAEAGMRECAKETGFHPIRDIDTVIVGTAAGEQGGGGLIVRGRHLDEKRLGAYVQELKREDAGLVASKRGARTLWSSIERADLGGIFLDDTTLLLGSKGWAERMADLADGVGSTRSAASNADLVGLLRTASGHAIAGASLEPELLSRFLQERDAGAGSTAEVRHATWTVDAGQRINIALSVELTSPAAAAALARRWQTKMTEPKIASMFRVRAEDTTFLLDADVGDEGLTGLALVTAMFAAVFFVHMD